MTLWDVRTQTKLTALKIKAERLRRIFGRYCLKLHNEFEDKSLKNTCDQQNTIESDRILHHLCKKCLINYTRDRHGSYYTNFVLSIHLMYWSTQAPDYPSWWTYHCSITPRHLFREELNLDAVRYSLSGVHATVRPTVYTNTSSRKRNLKRPAFRFRVDGNTIDSWLFRFKISPAQCGQTTFDAFSEWNLSFQIPPAQNERGPESWSYKFVRYGLQVEGAFHIYPHAQLYFTDSW